MLFSDEARFSSTLKAQSHNDIVGYGKVSETPAHIGPGAYFAQAQENQRGGWSSKSFSKREPWLDSRGDTNPRANYTTDVLLPSGIIVPGSPLQTPTPGPGHYNPVGAFGSSLPSPSKSKPNTPRKQESVAFNTGSTSRLLGANAVCKDGIIFQASTRSSALSFGPGYYNSPESDLIKKSHNARVKSASKSPRSGSTSPRLSPYASPSRNGSNNSFLNSPSKYLVGGGRGGGNSDRSYIHGTPNK